MITELTERGIDVLFWGSMLAFVATLLLLSRHFSVIVPVILGAPGLLLSLLYYPSKRSSSDYLYYFVLDGLMMLSAPLIVCLKFAR